MTNYNNPKNMPEMPKRNPVNGMPSMPHRSVQNTEDPTRNTMPQMPAMPRKTTVSKPVEEIEIPSQQSVETANENDFPSLPTFGPDGTVVFEKNEENENRSSDNDEKQPVERNRKPISNVTRKPVMKMENNGGDDESDSVPPKKLTPSKKSNKKPADPNLMPIWAMILMSVIAVIIDILVVYVMYNTTMFATFSKSAFVIVNIVVTLILLGANLLLVKALLSGKKVLYRVSMVLLAVLIVIGSYGAFAMNKVTSNVEKITSTVVQESVSTSFVVYSESGTSSITDISQLEGKIVGYSENTNTSSLGQKQLMASNVNASTQSYKDYSSELIALFNGEIDCAILPTNYISMFGNEASMKALLEKTSSIMDFEETVTVKNSSGADKDITKEPFTVLLIGNADGLSDTMILCSVNPISLKVTMSSLARDSWVYESKLNSYRAGGVETLISVIENLMGIDIDYYVDINFQGVVDIVDAVGGVVVNSPLEFVGQSSSDERGHYTVWVPAGENVVLNGEQALAFARERKLFADGDFARQEHQQQVIEAIIQKIMRTRDVNTFLKVLDAAGNNIQTNFSVSQMTDFFRFVMQKANRYYDSEHIEKIFDIQTSRVTGYSSGKWDAGLKLSLYIYRLWNGSLVDTANAIRRNIDLQSFKTYDTSRIKWSINWETELPRISYDIYPEAIIASDVPPEEEEAAAEAAGCAVNQTLDSNGNCVCKGGYVQNGEQGCVLATEIQETSTPVAECNANEELKNGACVCKIGYSDKNDGNGCTLNATPTPEVVTTPTPGAVNTPEPTPEPTVEPTQEPDPEPTVEPEPSVEPDPVPDGGDTPPVEEPGTAGEDE